MNALHITCPIVDSIAYDDAGNNDEVTITTKDLRWWQTMMTKLKLESKFYGLDKF